MIDPIEAFRVRFRDRCAVHLIALEKLRNDGVRSGEELGRIAHGLSGSGGTFGFPAISDAAAAIDNALIDRRPATDNELEGLITALRDILG